MDLRRRIDELLELPDAGLIAHEGAELEDVLQRGFVAVQVAEVWVSHLKREFDNCSAAEEERLRGLSQELCGARSKLAAVRRRVTRLYERAQSLGVGSLSATIAPRSRVAG